MTKLVNCNTEEASESFSSSPLNQRLESSSPSKPLNHSLTAAVKVHVETEAASFHTPGHKGRKGDASTFSKLHELVDLHSDVTELPGLDDLSAPQGVLQALSDRAARLWRAESSLLSVNGASAGLVAAILSLSARGSKLLVPRNAHKSVVNGLVLSGLSPVWYQPQWNNEWQLFGSVAPPTLQTALEKEHKDLAGVVVVSPTYGGAVSDIASIAELCHKHNVPLIVDEAHGAHFLPGSPMPASAIQCGADVVVHSLHKTLGALTQSGAIHTTATSLIDTNQLQSFLNIMQTTSPSYPMLLSIENTISDLEGAEGEVLLQSLHTLAEALRNAIRSLEGYKICENGDAIDGLHILVSHRDKPASMLYDYLVSQNIYPETVLGNGVLFMLGVGTTAHDISLLVDALGGFHNYCALSAGNDLDDSACTTVAASDSSTILPLIEQAMSPRAAALAPSHLVPRAEAENRIASECIAPCPPGVPLCVPGQKLTKEVLRQIAKERIRIVS